MSDPVKTGKVPAQCLRNLSRDRLLREMVRGVTHRKDEQTVICAMVIDHKAIKIISSSCKAYDMIEDGIVVWEGLEKARQPLPELDVIYFLSPTIESIRSLLNDFENDKRPKYRDVHLFFTTALPPTTDTGENLIAMIAQQTNLVPRVKTFVELNLAYVSYEERVFHLDMPDALSKFYHPHFTSSPTQFQSLLSTVADRLSTLFATFNELPDIRYHSGNHHGRMCEVLAQQLQMRVNHFKNNGMSDYKKQNCTLIIVERSFDMGPVLMHGTNFQAQIYDMLGVGTCSMPQKSEDKDPKSMNMEENKGLDDIYTISGAGDKSRKDFVLTDANEIYGRIRHKDGSEVARLLNSELSQYLSESKVQKIRTEKNNASSQDMISGLRELPQYRKMCDDYSALIIIATRISNELHTRSMGSYAMLEHKIASGLDDHGKELKFDQLLDDAQNSYFNDASTPIIQKARLLLLILCYIRGFNDMTKEKLLEPFQRSTPKLYRRIKRFLECGLHQESVSETAKNLFDFGVTQKKEKQKEKVEEGKIYHKIYDDKETLERAKKRNKSSSTALTYQNQIRFLVEDAINDNLPIGAYPYVSQPENIHSSQMSNNKIHADVSVLKAKNRAWDFAGMVQNTASPEAAKEVTENGGYEGRKKVVVFIIGGITYPEMKDVYELAQSTGTDVYIGGTSIYTPESFLSALDIVPEEWSAAKDVTKLIVDVTEDELV